MSALAGCRSQAIADRRWPLKASASALPLSALDLISPGLGLSGVADGEATIGGTPGNPTGEWRMSLKRVIAPQLAQRRLAGA